MKIGDIVKHNGNDSEIKDIDSEAGVAKITYNLNRMQFTSWVPFKSFLQDQSNCWHEFEKYVGFTEIYNYCVKCDKKDL